MTVGPIITFDKSALQSLNVDEAVWLDTFYRANITPVFFVETLADLEKQVAGGKTPEQVVGNLALKTPARGALANMHHSTLAINELLGTPVEMRHFPIIPPGRAVVSGKQRGVVYDTLSELEALERWQAGQFLTVERQFAKRWRQALSGIDLRAIYNRYRPAKGMKMRDLAQAKQEADRMVQRPRDYSTLQFALDVLGGAADQRSRIVARWRSNGEPPLAAFAPYAAHVVAVDLLFNFGLGSDLISRDRPTNKIDMAYLYYLPFCMVFVSNDNLHARAATCFLAKDQVFLSGRELKADLAKLDAHYSQLPEEVRQRGVMVFARRPPADEGFLVSRLWDQFLPEWRKSPDRA